MKVEVFNIKGEQTGRSVELPEEIFGIEPNEHVVWLAVKAHLANQRTGTHKAKEKGEIKGSTRKLKKQKGTGTARAGSIKSPVFRGGGRIFGPKPRDYRQKLNKKVKQLARKSVLADKAQGQNLIVVEDFTFEAPKTKEFINILGNLNAKGKSLFVTADQDSVLYKSGRNVPTSGVVTAKNVNTYEIINANTLILSESSIAVIADTFA